MISLLRSILFALYKLKRIVSYAIVFTAGVGVGLAGISVDTPMTFIRSLNLW